MRRWSGACQSRAVSRLFRWSGSGGTLPGYLAGYGGACARRARWGSGGRFRPLPGRGEARGGLGRRGSMECPRRGRGARGSRRRCLGWAGSQWSRSAGLRRGSARVARRAAGAWCAGAGWRAGRRAPLPGRAVAPRVHQARHPQPPPGSSGEENGAGPRPGAPTGGGDPHESGERPTATLCALLFPASNIALRMARWYTILIMWSPDHTPAPGGYGERSRK